MENENEIRERVNRRVNKEYRSFRTNYLKSGKDKIYRDSLKITFYNEMFVYVINAQVPFNWVMEMDEMPFILDGLWQTYHTKMIEVASDHFLSQLLEFHHNNLGRLKQRELERFLNDGKRI